MFISVPPLTESTGWRGKQYPAGCKSIPVDLAIALGVVADSAKAEFVDSGIPESASEQSEISDSGNKVGGDLQAAIARLAELESIFDSQGKRDWQAIREIGNDLGVEKHPDGWDSSFLRIIEAEFSAEIAAALEAQ